MYRNQTYSRSTRQAGVFHKPLTKTLRWLRLPVLASLLTICVIAVIHMANMRESGTSAPPDTGAANTTSRGFSRLSYGSETTGSGSGSGSGSSSTFSGLSTTMSGSESALSGPETTLSGWSDAALELTVNSENALLMAFDDGGVIYDKNGAQKMFPASMVKIMTALVALDHYNDLEETVTLGEEIFQPIYDADAVTAGFVPGESVRVDDLLYGLLLPSGAECAVGLAAGVAGSEKVFVRMMNEKARELGMDGSKFVNATGLHDKNQYSTALDMAVLFRSALKNETFYRIITSVRHSTPPTNRHEGGITYKSTLLSRIESPEFIGGTILGGKTGFTDEAGQCLASLAEIDGDLYVLVTAGAPGDNRTQKLHIDDAFTIYSELARRSVNS